MSLAQRLARPVLLAVPGRVRPRASRARCGERSIRYQELLEAVREVVDGCWPISRAFIQALTVACLEAEAGGWERAAVELRRASAFAPGEARRRLHALRLRALRAASLTAHRAHDPRWFARRREA